MQQESHLVCKTFHFKIPWSYCGGFYEGVAYSSANAHFLQTLLCTLFVFDSHDLQFLLYVMLMMMFINIVC